MLDGGVPRYSAHALEIISFITSDENFTAFNPPGSSSQKRLLLGLSSPLEISSATLSAFSSFPDDAIRSNGRGKRREGHDDRGGEEGGHATTAW